MTGPRAWLRAHWQSIAALLFIVVTIVVANMVLRPTSPLSSGMVLTDNPGVEGGLCTEINPADFGDDANPYMPLVGDDGPGWR
jgi:hypothetical protein